MAKTLPTVNELDNADMKAGEFWNDLEHIYFGTGAAVKNNALADPLVLMRLFAFAADVIADAERFVEHATQIQGNALSLFHEYNNRAAA